MTNFTYTGDDERYYPSLSLTATPGVTADLAELPTDGRWAASGSTPAPVAPDQPALPLATEGAE